MKAMNCENTNYTRRNFLKTAAIAGAGANVIMHAGPMANGLWGAAHKADNDNILVVVELGGGNDGLNTCVPFADDTYYKARPTLAVDKKRVLKINDYFGLHEKLKDLKSIYDDGNLAIINGVGYPNPNRSHFRSMEIWRTASDSDKYERNGWVGNYLDDLTEKNFDPLFGIAIAPNFPQTFTSNNGAGVSFQQAGQFKWKTDGDGGDTIDKFRRLNKVQNDHNSDSNIDFLRRITQNIAKSSDRVLKTAAKGAKRKMPKYPAGNNRLSIDLKTIANLINGGLPTKVYYASFNGFDTHANQVRSHESLIERFGQAVNAFYTDLKQSGHSKKVTILCYSEFGRRVAQNGSQGTDHGTAGPMFVIGDNIKAGVHGKYPSLTDLDAGDLKYNVDFRSVYSTILNDWFKTDSKAILGKNFNDLELIS